jgi:hypothetical protein
MSKAIKTTLFLTACTLIVTACGDNKKKDNFTRINNSGSDVSSRPQAPNGDGTEASNGGTGTPAADGTAGGEATTPPAAQATKCHVLTSEELQKAVAVDASVNEQIFCNALKVKTDDENKIIWEGQGRHSQEVLDAYNFTQDESVANPSDSKKITATYESKFKAELGKEAQVLLLGYTLTNKISQIEQNETTKVIVKINGTELTAEQFEVVSTAKDNSDSLAKVQIKDVKLFENIEFEVEISYSLK